MNFKSIFSVFTASMLCLGVCTAATPKKETKSKSPITIGTIVTATDKIDDTLRELKENQFGSCQIGHNGKLMTPE